MREDTRILQAGVHVVVGTPGRVYDMLRRRALRADAIRMFMLDEADEMLSRGFKDQIYDIFQLLPPKLQVSSNWSKPIGRVTCKNTGLNIGWQYARLVNECLQVGVFSATLPPEALEITRKFMNKPVCSGTLGWRG